MSTLDTDTRLHAIVYERLRRELATANVGSVLPQQSSVRAELNALLVRLRLEDLKVDRRPSQRDNHLID